jgi:hypothetical protein
LAPFTAIPFSLTAIWSALLAGNKIDMPPIHREGNATFKKAARQIPSPSQGKLDI